MVLASSLQLCTRLLYTSTTLQVELYFPSAVAKLKSWTTRPFVCVHLFVAQLMQPQMQLAGAMPCECHGTVMHHPLRNHQQTAIPA
jgi:hypothetical protein